MTLQVGELAGLELFLDTLRLGSISAAARLHRLSQPSATERIRSLERQLSVTLLQRGPSGSAPTPAGEMVAQWAQAIIGSTAVMDAGVTALKAGVTRHPLSIMASLTVAEYVMPNWLHHYRVRDGGPVELRMGNSTAVAAAIADGSAHLGFVEGPQRYPGLRTSVVGGDQLIVITSPDHPWARRRSPLTINELAATSLLSREVGSGTRDAFEAALHAVGATPSPPSAVMASTTMLKSAVAAGDGVAAISELAVATELAIGTLVAININGLSLHRDFRAIWHPARRHLESQRFLRLARSAD
jgi:DNA-binding transcriptional LysR family regulator